jgi:hypothetical protein
VRDLAAGELTLGVLTQLALTEADSVVVVELVAQHGWVAGEVGEEGTATCLDRELTQDRILDPHQPGHRVDQHGVRGEAVEQDSCVHVEDVIDSHGAVQLAEVVTAGGDTLDRLHRSGGLAGVHIVVVHNGAQTGDEVEDVLFLVTGTAVQNRQYDRLNPGLNLCK